MLLHSDYGPNRGVEKFIAMKKGIGLFLDLLKKEPSFYLENFDHLEIQDFALPENLDSKSDFLVKEYKALLSGFKGTLSLHGPFKEMIPSSMDRQVQELTRNRFSQALLCGKALGCELMVVHSCFNPLMRYKEYKDNWLENTSLFWDNFLPFCLQHEMVIALENVWDSEPEPMLQLFQRFGNPSRFGACLDTGHAHIFSNLSIDQWVQILGKYLIHLHVHDNGGMEDEHLPPGQGTINFSGLNRLSDRSGLALVSEVFGFVSEGKAFLDFYAKLPD